jgi:hypothetical protein
MPQSVTRAPRILLRVPPAGNLARRLVDYDPELAAGVLGLIVERLGGPREETDTARLQTFLSRAGSGDDERAKTTVEWKAGFAQNERLRALGAELAELLRARP